LKLVIEIDGGYHLKRDQKEYDKFRATDLSNLGITILRFTNDQVEKNIKEVLHEIELQVAHRTPNP
jgi:very-short-patch-repair endonuclease